jgi:hypothetical protein
MHWFRITLYSISSVLFLGFVGWVTTRVMHWDTANYWMGKIIIWDLYAVGVLLAYVAFVGGWHLWEKLTGRMEPTSPHEPPAEG